MSKVRRRGREAAVQFLYASDLEGALLEGQNLDRFWTLCTAKPAGREFAQKLVHGLLTRLEEIDALLAGIIENYDFNRLAAVDRNILRLATYELLYLEDVPPRVAINEAIEIAKAFGSSESGRFVNGVLDRIHQQHLAITPDA